MSGLARVVKRYVQQKERLTKPERSKYLTETAPPSLLVLSSDLEPVLQQSERKAAELVNLVVLGLTAAMSLLQLHVDARSWLLVRANTEVMRLT